MARNTTGVKIDPKAVPAAEYDTACRILHSSIRLALQNPTLRREYIAKTVYGEALIAKSDTRRAAVVWCILNRVDSRGYPNTIEGVVTEPHRFSGYDPDHPVLPELRDLVIDVLQRWNAEKNGETEVGRVLPRNYCFFVGDGFENHFSDEWKSTDYWDWSLPSPYES